MERILNARERVGLNHDPIARIAQRAPVLAAYIGGWRLVIAGKLALSGAPPELVKQFSRDAVEVIAIAVVALCTGHDELWRGVRLEGLNLHSKGEDQGRCEGCEQKRSRKSSFRRGRFADSADQSDPGT